MSSTPPNVSEGNKSGGFFTPGISYNAPPGYKDLWNQFSFSNLDPGLGPGRFGKQIVKAIMGGNADQDSRLAGFFNPLRNAYATNLRDLTRNVDMRSGLATGQQLANLTAQEGNQIVGAGEQLGMGEQNMVPGLFSLGANLWDRGRQERIQAQDFGLTGQENLINLLNQSKTSTPSIMQDLSGVANLAGQILSLGMIPPSGINAPPRINVGDTSGIIAGQGPPGGVTGIPWEDPGAAPNPYGMPGGWGLGPF